MLSNKKYVGVYTYGDDIAIKGGYPALMEESTFNKVQELVEKTKKAPARARAKVEYYLAGKLFCGVCGEKMIAVGGTSGNGEQHYYYKCKCKDCVKKAERKGFIEWYIVEQLQELLNIPERKELLADKVIAAYKKFMNTNKITDIKRQIAGIDRRLSTVIDMLIERKTEALLNKMDELELQKSELV